MYYNTCYKRYEDIGEAITDTIVDVGLVYYILLFVNQANTDDDDLFTNVFIYFSERDSKEYCHPKYESYSNYNTEFIVYSVDHMKEHGIPLPQNKQALDFLKNHYWKVKPPSDFGLYGSPFDGLKLSALPYDSGAENRMRLMREVWRENHRLVRKFYELDK